MVDPKTMRLAGWSAVVVLLLAAVGCAHGFQEGTEALGAGEYDRAQIIADDELTDDPDSPWGNLLMAEALVAQGEHRKALSYAQRAEKSDAFPGRASRLVGDIYRELGRPVDAADAFHRARDRDADSVDDEPFVEVLEAGLTYARTRTDHESSWRLSRWLADVVPDHPDAAPEEIAVHRRAYAVELRRQGQYFDASELLERALEDDPRHLRGEALDLGEIYARLQMPEDAHRAWRFYLDTDVDDDAERFQRHLDVANLASQHGYHGIAVEVLEAVSEEVENRHRRAELLLRLGRYQMRAGQGVEARRAIYEYVDFLTADAPEGQANSTPYREATELAFELDQTRLAINLLERGIHEAQPSRELTRTLVDIYARRAQLDNVEETLDLYIDRRQDSIDAALFAGDWALERHNYELARHYYERTTEMDGAPARAWFSLAEALAELEEHDEMSRVVYAYIDARDEADDALREAASLFADHRMFEQAERLLERIQRRMPENRAVAIQFAELYGEWSRPDDMASVWESWIDARGSDPGDIEWVARRSRRAGDLGRASQFYRRAAEAGNVDAWLHAADIYLRQDRNSAMAQALESYLESAPDRARALQQAADRYRRADMEARHVDVLVELVDLRPDSWQAHERLATLLLDQGRSAEAFEHLRHFVERADDPVEALDRISSPVASSHPPSWLLDFYQIWADDDAIGPAIDRLLGDAYYALSVASSTSDDDADYAHRRARQHYLDYLEATDGASKDWRRLATTWRQHQMWRPAAIAFDRYTGGRRGSHRYSLAHAETLLRLGDADRALQLLENHFRSEQRRPEVARRIANLLREFRLYDDAEEFAGHLFLSGDDSSINEGFHILAEIYEEREDFDRLDDLVTEYMNRATNATRARRAVIHVLESAGQWELAADQLTEFEISTISQFAVDIGFHHYRSGASQRAFAAFEEAAHHAHRPELAWKEAAEFLEARGEQDMAQHAYDRAVQANPDELSIRAARGAFAIRRGDLDAGWSDYEFSRRSASTFRPSRRASYFHALRDAGQFDRARQVIDHMSDDGLTAPGDLQRKIGEWQLRSTDRKSREDAVDLIRAGSWGIHDTLTYLDDAGHYDLSLQLIDDEFVNGDPMTAGALLLNRATTLSRLVGWSDQQEWLRTVVDPLARSDVRLLGPVGDHRARSGELDNARLYLQAAVDHRQDNYQAQLAHAQLLFGEREEALRRFETMFFDVEANPKTLEAILLRFELTGDVEAARMLLDRLTDEPSLIDFTLPYKVHYELEQHGDPERAIDDVLSTLRSLEKLPSTAFRQGAAARTTARLSRDDVISAALIQSLKTIAALGHVEAVEASLDRPLPAVRPHQLRRLRLHLALAVDDIEGAGAIADELIAMTDDVDERQQMRLDLARTFISFGAHDQAQHLVDDALDEQLEFRSHHPFVLHLGLLVLAGDSDLSGPIDDYLQRVPNRHHARITLIDELRRLGRDAEALRLARHGVSKRPTASMVRQALVAALDEGDEAGVQEFVAQFFTVADDPVDELGEVLAGRLRGSEPEVVMPIIDAIRRVRPHDLEWIIEQARVLFSAGDIQEGRQLLLQALDRRDYQRDAVTEVVDMLVEESLDTELGVVVAGRLPDQALWPHIVISVAKANYALEREDEAAAWLRRLDETTDRPALWRQELAERLARRQLFGALGPVLATVDEDEATGPYLGYLRALHQLATDEPTAGVDGVRRANAEGVDQFRSHYAAIRAALTGGHSDAAIELMEDMVQLPMRDDEIVNLPLQAMLSAAMPMPDGPDTIRNFLERQRPRLVDGYGATWTQFAGQLARAFENTDDPEGAYGFYRDRIWQSLLLRDDDALPIYLNNLAYTYATTDHFLDRGYEKALRAIVLRGQRSASFLDTLGWILYRQGDLEGAEAEVRRALRTFERGPSGLHELYDHLQIILDERHQHRRAVWLEVNRNRLPPPGFEW